jgi:hypothetical protein
VSSSSSMMYVPSLPISSFSFLPKCWTILWNV